ncbi:MAG: hypothetical protein WBA38_04285 [Gordonia sp. (in: high G+C Gram-positive bacteria)]|uniref:hypothetical protein n=1 Tax=Gordonia sp. (in: high G+C Gram-positive bacteria) TaxID=84139 RepID=UPI003C7283D4
MQSTRRELVREGIQNCETASAKVARLRSHSDPAVKEIANAIHFLSFGVRQIGQALAEDGRIDDLPIQRAK